MHFFVREDSPQGQRFDDGTQSVRLPIGHDADVGEARRAVRGAAVRAGFDEEDAERTALVVTEYGNNIVRHAGEGAIVVTKISGPLPALEIISIDSGPGIPDIPRALQDGHSTAGTSGVGLGGIRRLSDQFDAHSRNGEGTVMMSRITRDREHLPEPIRSLSAICLPRNGEEVSGDSWAASPVDGGFRIIVADGLGHGYAAAEASIEAVRRFRTTTSESPVSSLERIHEALRHTRGAAVSIADVGNGGRIDYCGLGNVRGILVEEEQTQSLVSMNGTAGHRAGRNRQFSYDCPEDSILIIHSDGLRTKWSLDDFRGLRVRHPAVIAGVLLRDCERRTDDVCVTVWRRTGG